MEECLQTFPSEKKVGWGRWMTHCNLPSSSQVCFIGPPLQSLCSTLNCYKPLKQTQTWVLKDESINTVVKRRVSELSPTYKMRSNLRRFWVGIYWIPVLQGRQTVPASSKDFIASSCKLLHCSLPIALRSCAEGIIRIPKPKTLLQV